LSVRGEYRRIGADLLAALGDTKAAERAALASQLERAAQDLTGAAQDTAQLLPDLRAIAPADTEARLRFDDAYERLEAICRIIVGR
jgi:hypothetical protein